MTKLVDVYWNLHKCKYSVRDCYTGKVFDHRSSLVLKDATFNVQKGGRQRVLREGKKNVHASIRGEMFESVPLQLILLGHLKFREITYDPYKFSTFVYSVNSEPITDAEWVVMSTCDTSKAFIVTAQVAHEKELEIV